MLLCKHVRLSCVINAYWLTLLISENYATYHRVRFHSVYDGNNESKDGYQEQQTSRHNHEKTRGHDHISAEHGTNEVHLCDVQVDEYSNNGCSS